MNKLYHRIELSKWKSLLELIEEHEIEKVLWYIRKRDNKELPKEFERELIGIDISPEIGKVSIKDKTDIGIKKILTELEDLDLIDLYQKLDILEEMGVSMMAYLPSKVYTPRLKNEGHLTHTIDYKRQRQGKIISTDRYIITDGKSYKEDEHTIIKNYNYVIYQQINNYFYGNVVLFSHAILDNFLFDNEKLYQDVESKTVRTREY